MFAAIAPVVVVAVAVVVVVVAVVAVAVDIGVAVAAAITVACPFWQHSYQDSAKISYCFVSKMSCWHSVVSFEVANGHQPAVV